MKVAVIQLNAGSDKAKNVKKALGFVKKAIARKAQLIVLPEAFNFRGNLAGGGVRKVAEKIPGESISPFCEIAKRKKVFIVLGSLCEKTNIPTKAYNTSVFIDDKGRIIAKYRKIHLFRANIGRKKLDEAKVLLAGKRRVTAEAKGFKIGFSVCYDLRFPDLYAAYARRGCHILTVPSSFTAKTGKAHWEVLVRARAIENACYVLAPNQVGKDGKGVLTYGNSMIVDPWGKILARASSRKEEIIYANITKDKQKQAHSILPFNKKKRGDS